MRASFFFFTRLAVFWGVIGFERRKKTVLSPALEGVAAFYGGGREREGGEGGKGKTFWGRG